MLQVLTNEGVWYDYHKQDIGFDSLLRELIKRANLSSDALKTFSKSGYPPDLFTWGSKE